MMMIFFPLIVLSFRRRRRRERDDQISKLLLPFSSIYEQRARIRATLTKRLCIHYSLVLVRIWWWYWWWWKWSEWIDSPKQRGAGGAAGERRKRNFLLFSFFFHLFGNDVSFDHEQTDTEFRGKEEDFFFFRKVSLSFSFSLFLSRRARESQHALTTLILFS